MISRATAAACLLFEVLAVRSVAAPPRPAPSWRPSTQVGAAAQGARLWARREPAQSSPPEPAWQPPLPRALPPSALHSPAQAQRAAQSPLDLRLVPQIIPEESAPLRTDGSRGYVELLPSPPDGELVGFNKPSPETLYFELSPAPEP